MPFYTACYEVLDHDTDRNDIIRPSVIQRYMQETANHQMRDCKPTYNELFEQGKAFILSRMAIKVNRIIKPYEKIYVQTWPSDKDKGASFTRSYEIYSNGEAIAQGLAIWALVDIKTKTLLRVNDVDLSSYVSGSPIELKGLRFRVPCDEMSDVGSFLVTYPYVDVNGHMNNTHYPDMVYAYIPQIETHYVTEYSFTYKAEAALGSNIRIQRSMPHKNDDDTLTYYFRTYVEDKVNTEAYIKIAEI